MSDLIRREDAIKILSQRAEILRGEYGDLGGACSGALKIIKAIPSAEPERKKGKWIVTSEFEDCRYVKCNQCKVTQIFYYNKPLTNFCPNCGAEMNRGDR